VKDAKNAMTKDALAKLKAFVQSEYVKPDIKALVRRDDESENDYQARVAATGNKDEEDKSDERNGCFSAPASRLVRVDLSRLPKMPTVYLHHSVIEDETPQAMYDPFIEPLILRGYERLYVEELNTTLKSMVILSKEPLTENCHFSLINIAMNVDHANPAIVAAYAKMAEQLKLQPTTVPHSTNTSPDKITDNTMIPEQKAFYMEMLTNVKGLN
jgi:hypothetical protein